MGALAGRLRKIPESLPPGCPVCNVYAGTMPGWDEEDATVLREKVDSAAGYRTIGAAIKGTGVSAESVRVHRTEKHADG